MLFAEVIAFGLVGPSYDLKLIVGAAILGIILIVGLVVMLGKGKGE